METQDYNEYWTPADEREWQELELIRFETVGPRFEDSDLYLDTETLEEFAGLLADAVIDVPNNDEIPY